MTSFLYDCFFSLFLTTTWIYTRCKQENQNQKHSGNPECTTKMPKDATAQEQKLHFSFIITETLRRTRRSSEAAWRQGGLCWSDSVLSPFSPQSLFRWPVLALYPLAFITGIIGALVTVFDSTRVTPMGRGKKMRTLCFPFSLPSLVRQGASQKNVFCAGYILSGSIKWGASGAFVRKARATEHHG